MNEEGGSCQKRPKLINEDTLLNESQWVTDFSLMKNVNDSTITASEAKNFPKYGERILCDNTLMNMSVASDVSYMEDMTTASGIALAPVLNLDSSYAKKLTKKNEDYVKNKTLEEYDNSDMSISQEDVQISLKSINQTQDLNLNSSHVKGLSKKSEDVFVYAENKNYNGSLDTNLSVSQESMQKSPRKITPLVLEGRETKMGKENASVKNEGKNLNQSKCMNRNSEVSVSDSDFSLFDASTSEKFNLFEKNRPQKPDKEEFEVTNTHNTSESSDMSCTLMTSTTPENVDLLKRRKPLQNEDELNFDVECEPSCKTEHCEVSDMSLFLSDTSQNVELFKKVSQKVTDKGQFNVNSEETNKMDHSIVSSTSSDLSRTLFEKVDLFKKQADADKAHFEENFDVTNEKVVGEGSNLKSLKSQNIVNVSETQVVLLEGNTETYKGDCKVSHAQDLENIESVSSEPEKMALSDQRGDVESAIEEKVADALEISHAESSGNVEEERLVTSPRRSLPKKRRRSLRELVLIRRNTVTNEKDLQVEGSLEGSLNVSDQDNPFGKVWKKVDDTFDIPFEETDSIESSLDGSDLAEKTAPLMRKKRKVDDTFNVSFEDTDPKLASESISMETAKSAPLETNKNAEGNSNVGFEASDSELSTESPFDIAKSSGPFEAKKVNTQDTFNVNFEETSPESSSVSPTLDISKSGRPFKTKKLIPQDTFNVNFEETSPESTSNSPSLDITKSGNPFKSKKVNIQDTFNVNFEETNPESSSDSPTLNVSKSSGPFEETSPESTSNSPFLDITKSGNPFKAKKVNTQDTFNVNFEETNPESSSDSPTLNVSKSSGPFEETSPESTSNSPSLHITKSGNPFKAKKVNIQDTFNVNFEETNPESSSDSPTLNVSKSSGPFEETSPESTSNSPFLDITKSGNPFKAKKVNIQDTFNVNFEETNPESSSDSPTLNVSKSSGPFEETSPESTSNSPFLDITKSGNPFKAKKVNTQDTFNVNFEETNPESISDSPSLDISKSSGPFKAKKVNIQDTFNVNFEETDLEPSTDSPSMNITKPGSPFKANKAQDTFNVNFEESTDSTSLNQTTPLQKSFFERSFDEEFDDVKDDGANLEEQRHARSEDGITIDELKRRTLPPEQLASPVSRCSTLSVALPASNMTGSRQESDLSMNQNVTVIDATERFKIQRSSPQIQSSILESSCGDNLDAWPSDDETPSMNTRNPSPVKKVTPPRPQLITNSREHWQQVCRDLVKNAERDYTSRKPRYDLMTTPKSARKPIQKNKEPITRTPRLKKPASFATKRFYKFLTTKLQPKFGLDAVLKAEELMCEMADVVKVVIRRKEHQKALLHSLKKNLAKSGIVETTYDFYEFVRSYLPPEFRVKVIPCVQPITNIVWPPKDIDDPFDKIPF